MNATSSTMTNSSGTIRMTTQAMPTSATTDSVWLTMPSATIWETM
jgi:hypothetical protein